MRCCAITVWLCERYDCVKALAEGRHKRHQRSSQQPVIVEVRHGNASWKMKGVETQPAPFPVCFNRRKKAILIASGYIDPIIGPFALLYSFVVATASS
jgi:hypothetical protein